MTESSRRRTVRGSFRSWLFSGAWVMCALPVAWSPRADAPKEAPPVATAHLPFVVRVRSDVATVCTGKLLAPNLVLTARHCIDVVPHDEPCAKSRFSTLTAPERVVVSICADGDGDSACAHTFSSASILRPAGARANDLCGSDVALVVLSLNIPSTVARAAEPDLSPDASLGTSYSVVGYGARDAFGSGVGELRRKDGLRHYCSAVPRAGEVACSSAYDMIGLTPTIAAAEVVVEYAVCPGGSGGGLFESESIADVTPRLVGIASRAIGSDACMLSIFSRSAAHHGFLTEGAREAAARGGYEAPNWAGSE